MRTRAYQLKVFLLGAFAFLLCAFVSLSIGPQGSFFSELLSSSLSEQHTFVLFELRLPRLLLAFAVGSLLSLSGLTYQTLFQNPIASPYTLGVSGGAAVGYILAQNFFPGILPPNFGWIFSAIGGGLILLVLLPLLLVSNRETAKTVLLVGVLISLFSGSLLFFLQYFLDPAGLVELTGWYFGSLNVVGITYPLVLFVLAIIFAFILSASAAPLDLLMFGREYASSHGVDVKRMQAGLIGLTTLCVALVIALCGPIGFLGLVIPHFARAIVGQAHYRLVPVTFFSGGLFLILSDIAARLIGGNQEIPVGLVTALIGCPVMMMLLLRGALAER